MFISAPLLPYVKRCGYDPFIEHICSDHRLMFLDLDKSLFASEIQSIRPPQQRGISSSDPTNVRRYIGHLHKLCSDQNLFK